MIDDFYIKNSNEDIKILKEELMSTFSYNYSDKKYVMDCVKQVYNNQIGHNLEENIREILEEKMNWKKGDIDRNLFYRRITFDNKNTYYIYTSKDGKEFDYNNTKWKFIMENSKLEVYYKNKKGEEKSFIVNDTKASTFYRIETLVNIGKIENKEMDGSFSIPNFDLSLFNQTEINVIYNKYDTSKYYQYCILEAKLSCSKFEEMVSQLEKDYHIISQLTKKNVIYLGILNDYNIDNIYYKNINIKFDCVIFSIKNSIFFGRDVRQFYDWQLIKRVNKLETEISDLRNEVAEVKKDISDMKIDISSIKNEFSELKETVNMIFSHISKKKSIKFCGKKKKRDENNQK